MFTQMYNFATKYHTIVTKYVSRSSDFLFRQLFDPVSSTYTYLLADVQTKESVLIDPVAEWVERDSMIIKELGLDLKYANHITGTGKLKKLFGSKSVISKDSGAKADILLHPGDEVKFGRHYLNALPTPGHTIGCMTYICREQGIVFTGDTLLIRGCGRTDFQGGSPEILYNSVHSVIFKLPGNFEIYPAHDYQGLTVTTVAEEKQLNPRLTKPLDEFIHIMNNLNLPYPKMIDKALPVNRVCGLYSVKDEK